MIRLPKLGPTITHVGPFADARGNFGFSLGIIRYSVSEKGAFQAWPANMNLDDAQAVVATERASLFLLYLSPEPSLNSSRPPG